MKEEKDIIDTLITDWKLERPELDTEAMNIVGRIIILGKILEKRASHTLKKNGIHYTDLDVLATIRRSGPPYKLTPKQLIKSVLITSGAMTALLDRLTKLGLIYREADLKDKRVKFAGLTEKGIQVIDEAIEIRFKDANLSIEVLDKEEYLNMSDLLRKLLVTLEEDN